jgi:TolB-like protein/Flp pilus assembly protein TadD
LFVPKHLIIEIISMDNTQIAAAVRFYDFGGFRLDVENKQLVKHGNAIPLNHKAFGVLLFLVRNSGQTARKEDIIESVWTDSFVEESNLTQHIYTLRKILDSDLDSESLIKTIPKMGYRFTASVSSDSQNRKSDVKTIAVLPFRPLIDSDHDEKLGLGMADAVITKLSKLQQVPVRPTGSIFRYVKQPPISPVSAGRDLGVDTVLEGTIQREGGRIRLTVQLISVNEEKTLWAESFNEDSGDIFTMQDLISERVARLLTKNLTNNRKQILEQRATSNKDAYQAYMLGLYFWNVRTREGLLKAVDYFKQAIALDPDYASAYAGIADAYGLLAYYHYDLSDVMYSLAKEAATKALALDPAMSEAYVALALPQKYLENDYQSSRLLLEKALELSPFNATAHQRFAFQLLADKEIDRAVSEMRLAQEYSPLSPVINTDLSEVLILQREFEEAAVYCDKAREIAPDSSLHQIPCADILFFTGQTERAIDGLEEYTRKEKKDYFALSRLCYFYAKTEKTEAAAAIYDKLLAEWDDSRSLTNLAVLAFELKRKDEAYCLLQKAVETGAVPFTVDYDPVFDDLRADPQYKQLFVRFKTADSTN